MSSNKSIQNPIKDYVAAISCGIVKNEVLVDLDYSEDSIADVDANFVICETGEISEVQVTGEEHFFTEKQYSDIFELAKKGIKEIIQLQKKALV